MSENTIVFELMSKEELLELIKKVKDEQERRQAMRQCCKICGVPLYGRYRHNDFDETVHHAWLYHPDLIDDYGWKKSMELIERGSLKGVKK